MRLFIVVVLIAPVYVYTIFAGYFIAHVPVRQLWKSWVTTLHIKNCEAWGIWVNYTRSPFNLQGLTFIAARISITSQYKVWYEIIIHSQTSAIVPLKLTNELIIPSHTLLGIWLLIHAGIEVDPY